VRSNVKIDEQRTALIEWPTREAEFHNVDVFVGEDVRGYFRWRPYYGVVEAGS